MYFFPFSLLKKWGNFVFAIGVQKECLQLFFKVKMPTVHKSDILFHEGPFGEHRQRARNKTGAL